MKFGLMLDGMLFFVHARTCRSFACLDLLRRSDGLRWHWGRLLVQRLLCRPL